MRSRERAQCRGSTSLWRNTSRCAPLASRMLSRFRQRNIHAPPRAGGPGGHMRRCICGKRVRRIDGSLPAARIADTGRRVPGKRNDLVIGLLNPDGMVIVEMDDRSQRLAIVVSILYERVSGQAGDSALDPGIARYSLRARDGEVLHEPQRLGMRPEI